MSSAFGSSDTIADCSLSERVAARVLSAWLPLLDAVAEGVRVRFDREQLRLAIHGEHEEPTEAYDAGQAVSFLWGANAMFAFLPLGIASSLPNPEPGLLSAAVAAVSLVAIAAFVVVVLGSIGCITKTELVDHTVPKQPEEELAGLQERFVNGDLDEEELAAEAERVIER